jgi:hypothetical protein
VNRTPGFPEVRVGTTLETMKMTAVEEIVETELERVERWRAEELMRAGYDPAAAHDLATRPDIDLHTARELLERGCPPELAAQILL